MHQFIFPIALCALAGCVSLPIAVKPRTSMQILFDKDAMRAEVLKYLSLGMPIENAKRIMVDSGFKCEDSFREGPPAVDCYAVHGTHNWCMDEIHVSLFHVGGKLTEVEVDCYTVGP